MSPFVVGILFEDVIDSLIFVIRDGFGHFVLSQHFSRGCRKKHGHHVFLFSVKFVKQHAIVHTPIVLLH